MGKEEPVQDTVHPVKAGQFPTENSYVCMQGGQIPYINPNTIHGNHAPYTNDSASVFFDATEDFNEFRQPTYSEHLQAADASNIAAGCTLKMD